MHHYGPNYTLYQIILVLPYFVIALVPGLFVGKKPVETLYKIVTLCMKLLWFGHTNSRQFFCNCPLFVIALVPGLYFGGKPAETCCHSVVASKWLKTQSVCFARRNTKT